MTWSYSLAGSHICLAEGTTDLLTSAFQVPPLGKTSDLQGQKLDDCDTPSYVTCVPFALQQIA